MGGSRPPYHPIEAYSHPCEADSHPCEPIVLVRSSTTILTLRSCMIPLGTVTQIESLILLFVQVSPCDRTSVRLVQLYRVHRSSQMVRRDELHSTLPHVHILCIQSSQVTLFIFSTNILLFVNLKCKIFNLKNFVG